MKTTRNVTTGIRVPVVVLAAAVVVATAATGRAQSRQSQPAGPPPIVVVLDTVKGVIEIELWPADAPKTVEHLVALFRRGFYRGLRFHRVNDGLAQIGDPLTRDMSKRLSWGSGGSGNPVGVAEITRGRIHQRGSVAMAHAGDPKYADSQIYIMKRAAPSLDGKHAVIGRVLTGLDVVDKIAVTDLIRNTSIKAAGPTE